MPWIADVLPEAFADWKCEVVALEVQRTFWEKATILHTEYHRPADKPTPDRFSRHYADTAALATHPDAIKAVGDNELRSRVAHGRADSLAVHGQLQAGRCRIIPSCPAAFKTFFAEAGLPSDARYVSLGASKLRRYLDDVSHAQEIENQQYRTTRWLTLVRSIPSTDDRPFSYDTDHYAGRVASEIRPQKTETQHQSSQRGLADRVDPRSVVELADLHQECKS